MWYLQYFEGVFHTRKIETFANVSCYDGDDSAVGSSSSSSSKLPHGCYYCFSGPLLRRKSSCFGSEFLPSLIRNSHLLLLLFFFLLFRVSSFFSSGVQMSCSTLLAPSDEEMTSLLCQFDVLQEVIRRKYLIYPVFD